MDTSETYIKMCDCEEIQLSGFHPDILNSAIDYPFGIGSQGDLFYLKRNRWIWLPRQDQLQEMVFEGMTLGQELPATMLKLLYDNIHFCKNKDCEYWHSMESMEQLWLAFVMKEKYNKIWDGDKWTMQVR